MSILHSANVRQFPVMHFSVRAFSALLRPESRWRQRRCGREATAGAERRRMMVRHSRQLFTSDWRHEQAPQPSATRRQQPVGLINGIVWCIARPPLGTRRQLATTTARHISHVWLSRARRQRRLLLQEEMTNLFLIPSRISSVQFGNWMFVRSYSRRPSWARLVTWSLRK